MEEADAKKMNDTDKHYRRSRKALKREVRKKERKYHSIIHELHRGKDVGKG